MSELSPTRVTDERLAELIAYLASKTDAYRSIKQGPDLDDVDTEAALRELRTLRERHRDTTELATVLIDGAFAHTCESGRGFSCDACDAITVWRAFLNGTLGDNDGVLSPAECKKRIDAFLSGAPDE